MKNKYITKGSMLMMLLSLSAQLLAWPVAVDLTADNDGDNSVFHRSTLKDGVTLYDRCDTSISEYDLIVKPSICHRWGLVFEHGGVETKWKPNVSSSTDYRLPTIKELIRLFDYSGDRGLDDIIAFWVSPTATEWLISSSYRDIDTHYDGGDTTELLQVFALNSQTGEVRAFQPNDFELCESLKFGGQTPTNKGKCNAGGVVTMHALKVNQTLLKDL